MTADRSRGFSFCRKQSLEQRLDNFAEPDELVLTGNETVPDELSLLARRRIRFLAWLVFGLGLVLLAGPGTNSNGGGATIWWAWAGMSNFTLGGLVLWAAR